MNRPLFALTIALMCACRPKSFSTLAEGHFAPPAGKRAVSVAVDRSQVEFLTPGDAVEIVILTHMSRSDGSDDSKSEMLAARAEILRLDREWGESTGLVSLALTPEEAQFTALAIDGEDRLFLNKLPDPAPLNARAVPEHPVMESGKRGVAVLVYPDQQSFLKPGDRVDVISTHLNGKISSKAELAATMQFQDVLVLGTRANGENEEWSTVQLMLSPEETRKMARSVGAEDGLTLCIRAVGDRTTRAVEPAKMSRHAGAASERSSPKS